MAAAASILAAAIQRRRNGDDPDIYRMMTMAEVWRHHPAPASVRTSQGRIDTKRAWFAYYGARCLFCDVQMILVAERSKRMATIDHIDARGLGGTNDPANIQVICRGCNAEKAALEGPLANLRLIANNA